MCAALAPGPWSDLAPIQELLGALEAHAGEIDHWFVHRPPQFSWHPRFSVVARLVQEIKNFNQLVNAAVATISVSSKYSVDRDWGPLLAAAFPNGDGKVTTEAQRRFLDALVKRAELWDPTNGNAHKWFKKAGLPRDRDHCARLCEEFSRAS
jgi:hypothetical protein